MKKFTTLFVGGGLSEGRKARFKNHLNRCSSCREEVRSLVRITERLKGEGVPSLSPDVWREFAGGLRSRIHSENSRRFSRSGAGFSVPRPAWVLSAGSVGLLLVFFSAALLMKGPIPPGEVLNRETVGEESLVAEIADFDNEFLEEVIGTGSREQEDWMALLSEARDEAIDEISLFLNRSEEEFLGEPVFIEEVIEEVLS